MPGLDPMLSGSSTDEIENSARLPLPLRERVGVRGLEPNRESGSPSPGRVAGDHSPMGRGGASRTASRVHSART